MLWFGDGVLRARDVVLLQSFSMKGWYGVPYCIGTACRTGTGLAGKNGDSKPRHCSFIEGVKR
jgi:hypothetical protein